MLNEISFCRNFIDIKKTLKLFELVQKSSYSLEEIKGYYSNDSVMIINLKDTVLLYKALGMLEEQEGIVRVAINKFSINRESFISELLTRIVKENLVNFLSFEADYLLNINYGLYALRNFLLAENLISHYHINNLYLVSESHKDSLNKFAKKKISKEQLLENLEKQNEYGEKAEILVIDYEKQRLNGKSPILHIALEDAGAGYDIKSYVNEESKEHDKYIEVKCYSPETKRFFISRNEIETSKKLGNHYFLYLVDSTFNEPPIIIPNPYDNIFNNTDVEKVVESYQISISNLKNVENI